MSRVLWIALLGVILGHSAASAADRPNVLFIAIDDLRDWVGYLGGHPQAKTPNLDRLAGRGMAFTRAYCIAPVCNPSRAALLSGMRPSTTGVYDNGGDWRPVISPEKTLPTAFRAGGYYTAGAGKIYHGGFDRTSEWHDYFHPQGGQPKPTGSDGVGGIKFAPLDCEDKDVSDYAIADWVIEKLGQKHDKPLFLCCGFHKPHMPWNVPKQYFDLFPAESVQLPPIMKDDLADVPPGGIKMAKPQGDHAAMLQSGRWKEAVLAYLATIHYLDMNVGRVLDALDKSPHRDNTIICLWSDHGWHLGEKEHWRKFALWEEATRSPLIWSVPGLTKPGSRCERPIDFTTIYPTLVELCGLEKPAHLQGVSIKPLLADPNAEWTRPAMTTFGPGNHAVRSDRWRYIRYADGGEELYTTTPPIPTNGRTSPTRATWRRSKRSWRSGCQRKTPSG